jgi:hypothetical protein
VLAIVHIECEEKKVARSFISEWFAQADKDLNGILSLVEATTIFSRFNQQLLQNTGLNKKKLLELFSSTDTNGDNMISIEEFKNAVLKNVQKIMELKRKDIQI